MTDAEFYTATFIAGAALAALIAGIASPEWRRATLFGALASLAVVVAGSFSGYIAPALGTPIWGAVYGCLGLLIRKFIVGVVTGTVALARGFYVATFKREP